MKWGTLITHNKGGQHRYLLSISTRICNIYYVPKCWECRRHAVHLCGSGKVWLTRISSVPGIVIMNVTVTDIAIGITVGKICRSSGCGELVRSLW